MPRVAWRRAGRPLTHPEGRWSTGSLVNNALKRTPLYDAHVKSGARMVPFGGWEMPVQYSGIVEEHRAVRAGVGCFDVSHMGELEVEGPQALAALQRLTTNDVGALEIGQVQYSLLCYPDGGIVDDLTLYRLASDRYMLTVNASNIDKDWRWVSEHGGGARRRNVSDTPRVWSALLEAGRGESAVPVGLGARDTLRLEMCYALYGNDIDETTNPLEAGLGWIVKPAKGDFVGRDAIEKVRASGPARKLVGIEMADRSVARHGYRVVAPGAASPIGIITSGSYGPSVERSIALAYVPSAKAAIGTDLGVEIRGQVKPARVVKTPFHPSRVKK